MPVKKNRVLQAKQGKVEDQTPEDDNEEQDEGEGLQGHPAQGARIGAEGGDPSPGGQQPPQGGDDNVETQDLIIGGRTYKLPKEVVTAFQAGQTDKNEIETLRRSIRDLEGRIKPPETKPAASQEGDDEEKEIATLLFTDTEKALKLLKKRIKEETVGTVSNAYVQDQASREFWDGFYSRFPEFDRKTHHWVIRQTAVENEKDLADLDVAKGSDRLAELTRNKLASLIKKADPGPKDRKTPRTTVEGGGSPTGRTSERRGEPAQPERPLSLVDVLKGRRQRRREAAMKRSA